MRASLARCTGHVNLRAWKVSAVVGVHLDLRPAVGADLADLLALITRAYRGESARKGWTHEADLLGGQRTDAEMLAESLADPVRHLLVHAPEGRPVACVELTEKGSGRAYLGLLTVDPEAQASGLGRALLAAAEAFAAGELGAKRIEMTVIVQRADLIAWYERRGYRLTGETRPFPSHDPRFGLPKRSDLEFVVLERLLS